MKQVYEKTILDADTITAFCFHPHEDKLLVIQEDDLIELSTKTFKELRRLSSVDLMSNGLTYTPNGNRIVIGSRSGVTFLNAFNGEELIHIPGSSIQTVEFSPDGEWLFTSAGVLMNFRAYSKN